MMWSSHCEKILCSDEGLIVLMLAQESSLMVALPQKKIFLTITADTFSIRKVMRQKKISTYIYCLTL